MQLSIDNIEETMYNIREVELMTIKIKKQDIAWFVQDKGVAYSYERTLSGLFNLLDLTSASVQYYKKNGMPISKILGTMVLVDMFEVVKWFHSGRVKVKFSFEHLHQLINQDIRKCFPMSEDQNVQKQLLTKFYEIVKDYEKSREATKQ